MTPSMRLSAIITMYSDHPEGELIARDLRQAYNLGHKFGIERAAEVVDQCNREGPYNAIGASRRIRSLDVKESAPVTVVEDDFLAAPSTKGEG